MLETTMPADERELRAALDAADLILQHIMLLDKADSEEALDDLFPGLLASIGRYTLSDRCYIFFWTSPEHTAFRMTHEWCAEGVAPTFDAMQSLAAAQIPNWMRALYAGEPIVAVDWEREWAQSPEEHRTFQGQGLCSLIAVPIASNKRLLGFLGLDNPAQRASALSLRLLISTGGHIGSIKENFRTVALLEQEQRQLEKSVCQLEYEKQLWDALCADYTVVYYGDLIEDTAVTIKRTENSNADLMDRQLSLSADGGEPGSFSARLRYYFDHFVIESAAPDFLERLSLESVRRALEEHDRLVYRFRAKPSAAGHEHFEVQAVRLSGQPGFRAIVGFRYIDDLVRQEDIQRALLENALAEAELNNEIISAISKLYWLIYRLDLESDTFEEVAAGREVHSLTGRQGCASERFAEACRTKVAPEYRAAMCAFLDISTLAQRLAEADNIETEFRSTTGNWHTGRFIVKKRSPSGRVTRVLYVVRRITEQKLEELRIQKALRENVLEAQRANIAKTDFLRRMSHDIRTPINGIRGMVAIGDHYPDDAQKQRECREKVMQASGFLLDLVNSALDMNKLESGQIVLEHKPFDLMRLLEETCSIVGMQGQEAAIGVALHCQTLRHRRLLGSPVHLRQVLQNIAGNAVKYNRDGGSVRLTCREISDDGERAVYIITCADTGIGMSESFVQHAFEPFAQENSGARTAYAGTGLGLAIAKQLVEMMDGSIVLESAPGAGTKFTVTIPLAIDHGAQEDMAAAPELPEDALRGLRALLVEDNALNMEIARFLLERRAARVDTALSGREAVELFSASPCGHYDFILMDIMMPEMNGVEATHAIRALPRADAQNVPIIAMSANAFSDDVQQSLAAGMNAHLSKPIDEREMIETIHRLLRP